MSAALYVVVFNTVLQYSLSASFVRLTIQLLFVALVLAVSCCLASSSISR